MSEEGLFWYFEHVGEPGYDGLLRTELARLMAGDEVVPAAGARAALDHPQADAASGSVAASSPSMTQDRSLCGSMISTP